MQHLQPNKFTVTRLHFVQVGTYQDMALRPYHSDLNQGAFNALQEATAGGTRFQPANLAGVAGMILRPSTASTGSASIANDWDTGRLAFMMEVAHEGFAGGQTLQYITGYTDFMGISSTGEPHPNMRLFINSSVMTRVISGMGSFGAQQSQSVASNNQLITGDYNPSFGTFGASNTFAMRPEDIFGHIGSQVLHAGQNQRNQILDTRNMFHGAERSKFSRRSNNSATNYLARAMKAQSYAAATTDEGSTIDAVMDAAIGDVAEDLIRTDPFITAARRASTSLVEGTSITFGELAQMSPSVLSQQVTKAALAQSDMSRGMLAARGRTEHWGGTTTETVLTTILNNSVPGLMADLLLTRIAFKASNQTIDGSYFVQVFGGSSFAVGVDLAPYIQAFQQRLSTEILRELTINNQIEIKITCDFNLLSESTIDISVNGQPDIRYTTPSFSDALYTPVLTGDRKAVDLLANDINYIADHISTAGLPEAFNPMNGGYSDFSMTQPQSGFAPSNQEFQHGNGQTV